MFPEFQSAYRKYHSTETALLRMRNDILVSMNKQQVTLLVFLDLSTAFDTVDHDILLWRLEYKFGMKDQPLTWFKSYLSNRSHRIVDLRRKSIVRPSINTERFKDSFLNRLIFKYNLAV